MTAALLAAVAGILGVTIGRFWDTRSESARWRRDQKTASYQRVVEQFQVTYEAVRVVALTDLDEDAFNALVEHTRTGGFASWDSAVAAVWLHGSADVVVAATQLDEAVGQLFYAAVERRIGTLLNWNRARIPAREAFERFVDAARKELDLSRVPVRIFADRRRLVMADRTNEPFHRDGAGYVGLSPGSASLRCSPGRDPEDASDSLGVNAEDEPSRVREYPLADRPLITHNDWRPVCCRHTGLPEPPMSLCATGRTCHHRGTPPIHCSLAGQEADRWKRLRHTSS